MISLVKNLMSFTAKYYYNHRYKSYITSLKAVITGKSLISAGLHIDRVLYFIFYDKMLQIYRQHWVRIFYWHILSKYWQFPKSKRGVTPLHPHLPCAACPWIGGLKFSTFFFFFFFFFWGGGQKIKFVKVCLLTPS